MLKYYTVLIAFLLSCSTLIAQDKKPKVALVLSGGGAKGVAHIPLLQKMDSLGIVPDLIVGNSMGSIVGGLYAMGYSGNEIADLAKHIKWNNLIGGSLSLDNVSNEEKSEFNQYLISAAIVKGKVKINPFILSDQNLRNFLISVTHPVYHISDFDSLPIPFRAIATDIVAGKEVVLDSGSLALAMRSSMSIPGIFSAVPYKNTLLIDGGVLNNFPTDVAKRMGADFIIGSDVGNGMLPKERLDNLQSLLFQSGMIASNLKNPANRKLCDILLSHGKNITYGTGDFGQILNIYQQGKIALSQELPKLIKISKKLKQFKQATKSLPKERDSITLDNIIYKGISKDHLNHIKARTNFKKGAKHTKLDIVKGINTAMGTALFQQIEYGLLDKENKTTLYLNASEIASHQIKGAVHYNNELGAGLILNYTGRNLIGKSSRSLITIDLAKNPKVRLQHQNIFGKNKNWWMRTELYINNYVQGLFTDGFRTEDYKYRFQQVKSHLNRNLSSLKSYVGIGIEYENTVLKPLVPLEVSFEEGEGINRYRYQNYLATLRFHYNTINKQYFATKGTSIAVNYKRSLDNTLNIDFFSSDSPEDINLNGSLAKYHKFSVLASNRFSVSPKSTLITGITGGFIFEDALKENENSFADYGVGTSFFLGGNASIARGGSFIVPGLKDGEVLASQFLKADVSFQYALQKKIFITPHMDLVIFGNDTFSNYLQNFTKTSSNWNNININQTGLIFSTGLTASYNSILGPINIDASFVNDISRIRFFVGIGYSFVGF
ncbi:patatin-like phospholipase family protein [Polaribacter batillariae]|uniref:Patatin-like phospholipase family protein n=1 Tax=Polaribacter batillariae TaxID=2808900 RepID=A0ABX7SYK8_9FLAO|nr:patatin-like phospholipase family protein [Polaribacter batillariae]QTD38086.1 patatin-like phospholipase family protein [Polaribacter batillariae]